MVSCLRSISGLINPDCNPFCWIWVWLGYTQLDRMAGVKLPVAKLTTVDRLCLECFRISPEIQVEVGLEQDSEAFVHHFHF